MSTRLIVMSGPDLIADIEEFEGTVPRVGEYIFHPPQRGQGGHNGGIAGCVKTVTHAIYTRPPLDRNLSYFVGRNHNVVEVHI